MHTEANEAKRSERKRHTHCYRMCRSCPAGIPGRSLQKFRQLVRGQTDLAEDGSKRALGHLAMIWNCDSSKGRLGVPQDDVAPSLAIHHVARPL
jgi:hypothetical protein